MSQFTEMSGNDEGPSLCLAGSDSAGLDSGSVLEKNVPQNPELGQGDNRTTAPGRCSGTGTTGETPPGGDISHGPAGTADDQVDQTGAARGHEQDDGEQNKRETVATNMSAENDTAGHPDSTEGSDCAGLDSGSVLEKNVPQNPELGQGDNRTTAPGRCSGTGTAGETPPGGDISHGPAGTADDQVDQTGAARGHEQDDGEQNKRETMETNMSAENDTAGHPDSTEGSDSTGLDSGSVLEKNVPQNPELGQGDNRTTAPGRCSGTGTTGETPPGGDISHGPAGTANDQVDQTGAAQAHEQDDAEQNKRETVATNMSAEDVETKDDSDSEVDDNDDPRTSQPSLVPEDIGAAADETDSEPVVEGAANRSGKATYLMLLAAVLVGLLAIWGVPDPLQPSSEQKAFPQVDVFIREMTALQTRFPGQRPELWKRSRIHLEKHLRTARPTEPVSLILAAGRGGERTLHCLAGGMASAFSAAHNASVLHIDGAAVAPAGAGRDSDQVKMDIDSELQGAFGGDRPAAAVIHRLEELPPGATLIFYRYCDHENAAYKRTFLLFTVLLEERALGQALPLNAVEEMVDDQLQRKFLSPGLPVAFDHMDRDKYSGLWSRISHLTLPVAEQPAVERDGC